MSTVAKVDRPVKPKPRPSKPRPAALRTCHWTIRPDHAFDGYGALDITEGKKTDTYLVRQIPADFGEGFTFEKLDAGLNVIEQYDVNLAGGESSCTCPGNCFHGHCRHVESLTALDEAGRLPRLSAASTPHCPRCGDPSPADYLCPGCEAEDFAAAYGPPPAPEVEYVPESCPPCPPDQDESDWPPF